MVDVGDTDSVVDDVVDNVVNNVVDDAVDNVVDDAVDNVVDDAVDNVVDDAVDNVVDDAVDNVVDDIVADAVVVVVVLAVGVVIDTPPPAASDLIKLQNKKNINDNSVIFNKDFYALKYSLANVGYSVSFIKNNILTLASAYEYTSHVTSFSFADEGHIAISVVICAVNGVPFVKERQIIYIDQQDVSARRQLYIARLAVGPVCEVHWRSVRPLQIIVC
jgi:hypothetical protein